MDRQTLIYLILFALAAILGGWRAYRWYHERERSYRRRRVRELAAYDKRMAAKAAETMPLQENRKPGLRHG